MVAFAVGPLYEPGNGFKIIGGHTDSPNLKVKPSSKRDSSAGCIQLGVECYGGGLWHTWFDRDLGISGRVLVRDGEAIDQRLVKVDKPVARVSTLCIHLQSAEERSAFKINKENHLTPIISTDKFLLENQVKKQLTGSSEKWMNAQDPCLMSLLAENLGVDKKDIADFELNLFDTQPAALGGMRSEFLYSGRLDNLATCFVSTEALIKFSTGNDFSSDSDISLIVLFDHEEVGSRKLIHLFDKCHLKKFVKFHIFCFILNYVKIKRECIWSRITNYRRRAEKNHVITYHGRFRIRYARNNCTK